MNPIISWERYERYKTKAQEFIAGHREGIGIAAACFAALTVLLVFGWAVSRGPIRDCLRTVGQVLAVIWALGPPIYFFIEWWSWAPSKKTVGLDAEKFEFEQFKYTQEIATKFWVGFAATLSLIFFKLS